LSLTNRGSLKEEIWKQEKDILNAKVVFILQIVSIFFAAFWITWYNSPSWWDSTRSVLWFLVPCSSWILFRSIVYFIAKHKLKKLRKEEAVLEVMES
jgi:hypothetical protein